ncbi:MAG: hypothetical protein Q9190_004181 [Brigantiaea leucoxantha]
MRFHTSVTVLIAFLLSSSLTRFVFSISIIHGRQEYSHGLSPLPTANQTAVRLVHQFSNLTWIENIAVRSNGHLLITLLTSPDLYELDPSLTTNPDHQPTLIHSFTPSLAVLGIAEYTHDVFAVVVGNANYATSDEAPGTYSVWSVDMNTSPASVSLISKIPEAKFLNGAAAFHGAILLADSAGGLVWRVDPVSRKYKVVLQSPLMAPGLGNVPLGICGIRTYGNSVYFTNCDRGILARVPVNPDGSAAGPYEIVLNNDGYTDDFAIDIVGNVYLAQTDTNTVAKASGVGKWGKKQMSLKVVAGNVNSSEIANPTACAFGRTREDANQLYVATNGGLSAPVNGTYVEGGKIVAVDLGRYL